MKERKTMKRLLPLLWAAAIIFTGASIWEGAVTTAPRGALPDEGYYAATNSFPRNTVVDITNLETGKTIRVIVSSGLDTPGLLATLSEDAAKSIGLQTRSIGRIRMTQPSDPIAFSRFTEGLTGSGDPDYDPEAMFEAEDDADEAGGFEEEPGLVLIPAPRQPVTEEPPVFSEKEEDYFSIVDLPNAERETEREEGENTLSSSAGEEDYYGEFPEDGETELAEAEEEDSPEKTLYPVWAQGGSVGVPVTPEAEAEIADSAPYPVPDPVREDARISAQPGGEPPAQLSAQADGTGSWASAWITAPQNRAEPPAPGTYDYSLVPAEKRPPADTGVYAIPPEAQIGPIVQSAPEPSRRSEPAIDGSLFIESIEDMRERSAVLAPSPVISAEPEEILPEPVLAEAFPSEPALPEPVIIVEEPALPEAVSTPKSAAPPKVAVTPAPTPASAPERFSIPVIGELEKGQYYLQLGAYSKPDVLESRVSKLDSHYPLSVQTAGSPDNPVYRLLLGPVNLGESGALLQRFRGSGYSDVFVRTY